MARWRLFKGRELDDADLAEIRAATSAERVMGDAYRLLGHRARSSGELRRRLLDKEHDEAVVEDALRAACRPTASSTTPSSRAATSPTSAVSAAGAPSASAAACASSTSRRRIIDDVLARRRRGRGRRVRPRPRRPAPQGRGRQTRGGRAQARLSGTSAPRVLLVGRLRGRAAVGRRRRPRRRIDGARRRRVLSWCATCVRALCIPLSLLHSDTDGAKAPMG